MTSNKSGQQVSRTVFEPRLMHISSEIHGSLSLFVAVIPNKEDCLLMCDTVPSEIYGILEESTASFLRAE